MAAASFAGTMARTLIGPETRIGGPLSGNDDLVVEGTVDGPVEGGAQVVIAAGAKVHGEVRGRDVVVGGALAFNVYATGSVRLLATAEVRADIECPRIAIDEGALFEGQVRMRAPGAKSTTMTALPAITSAARPSTTAASPATTTATPAMTAASTTTAPTPASTTTAPTQASTTTAPTPVSTTAAPTPAAARPVAAPAARATATTSRPAAPVSAPMAPRAVDARDERKPVRAVEARDERKPVRPVAAPAPIAREPRPAVAAAPSADREIPSLPSLGKRKLVRRTP